MNKKISIVLFVFLALILLPASLSFATTNELTPEQLKIMEEISAQASQKIPLEGDILIRDMSEGVDKNDTQNLQI